MVIVRVLGILALWIFTLLSVNALAQDDSVPPDKVLVGVIDAPPFAMKTKDGSWEGLSIELWQAIVQELGVEFELREYSSEQLLDAVRRGEVDVIPALAARCNTRIGCHRGARNPYGLESSLPQVGIGHSGSGKTH